MRINKRVEINFAWYDFWVGVYYARHIEAVYICLLPMIVIVIDLS